MERFLRSRRPGAGKRPDCDSQARRDARTGRNSSVPADGVNVASEKNELTHLDSEGRARMDDVSGKVRSEEHTSELQSRLHLVCRLLLGKKKKTKTTDGCIL